METGKELLALEALADDELRVVDDYLVYRKGDSVAVFENACPHAGRALDYAPGKLLRDRQGTLICAAHGAQFRLPGGECIGGPCVGAALTEVATEVRAGKVVITPST